MSFTCINVPSPVENIDPVPDLDTLGEQVCNLANNEYPTVSDSVITQDPVDALLQRLDTTKANWVTIQKGTYSGPNNRARNKDPWHEGISFDADGTEDSGVVSYEFGGKSTLTSSITPGQDSDTFRILIMSTTTGKVYYKSPNITLNVLNLPVGNLTDKLLRKIKKGSVATNVAPGFAATVWPSRHKKYGMLTVVKIKMTLDTSMIRAAPLLKNRVKLAHKRKRAATMYESAERQHWRVVGKQKQLRSTYAKFAKLADDVRRQRDQLKLEIESFEKESSNFDEFASAELYPLFDSLGIPKV